MLVDDMKIGIIGFNIFGIGGTSRSNLNLLAEFQEYNDEIIFFNTSPFSKRDISELQEKENLNDRVVFKELRNILKEKELDVYILTRESFFPLARAIKTTFPNAEVVGEVHAPIYNQEIDDSFAEEAIDVYRVSTISTAEMLKRKITNKNVVAFPISTRHIEYRDKITDGPKSKKLFIYSRFDESSKDISYAIRLMNYLVNTLKQTDVELYINGVGAGGVLYRNLINYFNLKQNVFLNREVPENYTYVSTSRAETFGYSIMEAFGQGMPVICYGGDDLVLKEIYGDFQSVCWIDKDIRSDAQKILSFLQVDYTNLEYAHDKKLALEITHRDNYAEEYKKKIFDPTFKKEYHSDVDSEEILNSLYASHFGRTTFLRKVYSSVRKNRFVKKALNMKITKRIITKAYNRNSTTGAQKGVALYTKPVNDNYVFVESFHGKNFSGDPKYIALALKEKFRDVRIFVSSTNQLVDMEIYDYGLTPVRTGSLKYVEIFQKSKLVIVNGNTLDKVGKNENQTILQTWHGFPLKKMVADLEDLVERNEQLEAFLPRMKKWDYLLSSSDKNTEYISSAFKLTENDHLKVLELGAPKNTYLINNKDDMGELEKIHFKYFYKSLGSTKYILYCPTWRKDERESVSQIDLKKFIELLPQNYELIVKLHPNESRLRKMYASIDRRVHCFYNELVDIQELYLLSEVLITDYSSAMFDFAHLNRKIVVFQEDIDQYAAKIGWYFDLEQITGLVGKNLSEEELAEECMLPFDDFYNEIIVDELMTLDTKDSTSELLECLSEQINLEVEE